MIQIVQRAGALGLLVLAIVVFAGATVMPFIMSYLDREIELNLAQGRHASLVTRRKDPSLLTRQFESLMGDMTASGPVTAASDDEAVLMAEQHIRAVLDRRQVPLTNWSVLPGSEIRGLRTLQAELAFVVPSSSVIATLSALESGRPTVFFERVVVRKQRAGPASGGGRAGEQTEVSGTVRLLVVTPDSLTRPRS